MVLTKVVTLFLAGEAMTAALLLDGQAPDLAPTILSSVLLVAFLVLLVRGARRLGAPAAGWLRPTLWGPAPVPAREREPLPVPATNGSRPAVPTS